MMEKDNSRRSFIRKSAVLSSLLLGSGFILNACNSSTQSGADSETASAPVDSCNDYSNVSEVELQKRESLGYVEKTPIPDSDCANCQLYIQPKEGEKCGGCQLFKGPVFEEAYCTYWAPMV